MSGASKGVLLGVIQIALVLSLGGKLLFDRMTRPRVWVRAEAYDPDMFIRGRYLSEQLEMPAEGFTYKERKEKNIPAGYENENWAYFDVRNGQLIARQQGSGPGEWVFLHRNSDGSIFATSEKPVVVFIPDHAELPKQIAGQEMWVEVTIPQKGPPRPIRIGIKKDGVLTPLKFN